MAYLHNTTGAEKVYSGKPFPNNAFELIPENKRAELSRDEDLLHDIADHAVGICLSVDGVNDLDSVADQWQVLTSGLDKTVKLVDDLGNPLTAITGAKGDKGDQGDVGATGSQGATGATGSQGPQGNQGPTGSQGIQGETGDQGAQGTQGASGNDGATGATGSTGPTGPAGSDGDPASFLDYEEFISSTDFTTTDPDDVLAYTWTTSGTWAANAKYLVEFVMQCTGDNYASYSGLTMAVDDVKNLNNYEYHPMSPDAGQQSSHRVNRRLSMTIDTTTAKAYKLDLYGQHDNAQGNTYMTIDNITMRKWRVA